MLEGISREAGLERRAARMNQKATLVKDLDKLATAGEASSATARALRLAACAKNYTPKGS
jgi:hypothetical protein